MAAPSGSAAVGDQAGIMGSPSSNGHTLLSTAGEPNGTMDSPPSKGRDTAGSASGSNGLFTPLPLKGRVAIVTGGSGGIGSEISAHLVSLGAKVVIGYAGDPAPAECLVSTLNSGEAHPRAFAVEGDVSDPDHVKALFDRAELAFGPRIHILVVAAGILGPRYPALADTSIESWERVFNVNAKGSFLCCREGANRLVRGGGGRIITMSSSSVGSLSPGYSTYSASKAAIEVMTRILAKELRGTGITANGIAPGPIATPLLYAGKSEERIRAFASGNPMGRLGEPKDVAPLVGFLATDAGEWVNGQIIRLNGGNV